MPESCRFYGIVIRMFVVAGGPHHRPHFHAYYQDSVAIYAVDSIELIAGELERTQHRLVLAWAEVHQHELLNNWAVLQRGMPPATIEPLR